MALHTLFEAAAFATGAWLYRRGRRAGAEGVPGQSWLEPPGVWVTVGLVFGAALGSKIVAALELPNVVASDPAAFFRGQSMVGGLVGGWLGVEGSKRALGIAASTGDVCVAPIAIGLAIGRVGCFLAGLPDGTYGVPTSLPWGVDFGDGLPRHPTQLYEIAFVLTLLLVLHRAAPVMRVDGLKFRLFFDGYLLWRLLVETIKPLGYEWPGGLHGIQWVAIAALAAHLPGTLRGLRVVRRTRVVPEFGAG